MDRCPKCTHDKQGNLPPDVPQREVGVTHDKKVVENDKEIVSPKKQLAESKKATLVPEALGISPGADPAGRESEALVKKANTALDDAKKQEKQCRGLCGADPDNAFYARGFADGKRKVKACLAKCCANQKPTARMERIRERLDRADKAAEARKADRLAAEEHLVEQVRQETAALEKVQEFHADLDAFVANLAHKAPAATSVII